MSADTCRGEPGVATKHAQLKQKADRQRLQILKRLDRWLEMPMVVLGFVWLILVGIELVWGESDLLSLIGTAIWVLFIVDFAVRLGLAPDRIRFMRVNWVTVLALALPALRIFRIFRAIRALRAVRAARGLRLVRLLTSVNRGMRALGASMRRRGFSYVVLLTVVVTLAGSAGMYAFEGPTEFPTYSDALWWTAMIMTTMGSDYWPKSSEGRLLCVVLSLYAFAVFGYTTASLATFFVGRDADDRTTEIAGVNEIRALRVELHELAAEVRKLRGVDTNPSETPDEIK
jgi:voltage-gated potassium channel